MSVHYAVGSTPPSSALAQQRAVGSRGSACARVAPGGCRPIGAPSTRHILRSARQHAMSSGTLSSLLASWTCWGPRRGGGPVKAVPAAPVVQTISKADDEKMTVAVTGGQRFRHAVWTGTCIGSTALSYMRIVAFSSAICAKLKSNGHFD
jgi:hypothetical protein